MTTHSGMMFSTWDSDNDANGGLDCSNLYGRAGNWYRSCYAGGQNLNGGYGGDMTWLPSEDQALSASRIMFRSVDWY